MNKKALIIGGIVLVLILAIIVVIATTSKKPGTFTISISTKDGIRSQKIENEELFDIKKNSILKKNKITDKTTGNTIEQEINEVRYELTAKKKGKTTLTVEYVDYKTGEEKKTTYEIEVDKDLKITVK